MILINYNLRSEENRFRFGTLPKSFEYSVKSFGYIECFLLSRSKLSYLSNQSNDHISKTGKEKTALMCYSKIFKMKIMLLYKVPISYDTDRQPKQQKILHAVRNLSTLVGCI